MLNSIATADFIQPSRIIPYTVKSRLLKLQAQWEQHSHTYRNIVDRLANDGIAFTAWRKTFYEVDNETLADYWDQYWEIREADKPDGPTKPGAFADLAGNDVLPQDIDRGDGTILTADIGMMIFSEMSFAELLLWADLVWTFSEEATLDAKLRMGLGAWALGGMFQLQVALCAEQCFNVDIRGRPPKGHV